MNMSKINMNFFLFYLLPSLIFFSPIFWMNNTVDYWGWSVMELTATLLLLVWVIRRELLNLPSRQFFLPLLLLACYCACSLLWSCNFHATLTGFYKIFFSLILLILFSNQPANWQRAIKCSVILTSSGAASLWMVIGSKLQMDFPNLFGGFLAMGGVLCVGLCLTSTGVKQWITLPLSILIALSLFFTVSLGPLLCWLVGTFLQFFIYDRKKVWILGCLFLALFSVSFLSPISGGLQGRTNPLRTLWQRKASDPFAMERIRIWRDSAEYFFHHPMIGTGLGTFRDVYPEFKKISGVRNAPYAHNEPINFICELGLTGVLIFGWWIWNFFMALRRTPEHSEGDRNRWKEHGIWLAVGAAGTVHSLVDFNLHYPPILILFLFCFSPVIPLRIETERLTQPRRVMLALFLIVSGTLVTLPGIAELIFRSGQSSALENPHLRQQAALTALQLDPFNGFYYFESGRMRNILIAIELEPRNVWYRRSAAQFFVRQWETGKKREDLNSAVEQYQAILKFAPNVLQFRLEANDLFSRSINESGL